MSSPRARTASAEPSSEALSSTSTSARTPARARSAATASRQRISSSRPPVLTTQKEISTATRVLSGPVKVHVVDPSAYTPPYDHALCAGARRAPASTSSWSRAAFAYGDAAGARRLRAPRAASTARRAAPRARPRGGRSSSPSTCPTCCATARAAARRGPRPLPVARGAGARRPAAAARAPARADRPRHPAARAVAGAARRSGACCRRFDAVIAHSRARPRRASIARARRRPGARPRDPPRRLRAPRGAARRRRCPPSSRRHRTRRSSSCFGLLRPYKGLDVLLDAWRGVGGRRAVGRRAPALSTSRRCARARRPERALGPALRQRRRARGVLPPRRPRRRCPTARASSPACSRRRSRSARRSLLSDVGGFGEVAAAGAARLVPPGDAGRAARGARPAARRRAARASGCRAAARALAAGELVVGARRGAHARALRVAAQLTWVISGLELRERRHGGSLLLVAELELSPAAR